MEAHEVRRHRAAGKTVGLVGLGSRLAVAARLRPWNLTLLAFDPFVTRNARRSSASSLSRWTSSSRSRTSSPSTRRRAETKHLLGPMQFEKMKKAPSS